jgi:hypothetical protein
MTDNTVRLPIPSRPQIEQWRSEASMYELPDECDAHIARRAAAWGAAAGVMQALADTAHCHWRVADAIEDGVQLVRAKDLTTWAETVFRNAVNNDVESDND